MATAIFIDGAFFIKRVRHFEPERMYDAKYMADLAFNMSMLHLSYKAVGTTKTTDELYRVFFYDCPPLEKKLHNPITKQALDLSKSDEAIFRKSLHKELTKKRKFALRLGKLSEQQTAWQIKPKIQQQLLKGHKAWEDLTGDDVSIHVIQKGVDMRIGLDIASVALKGQANKMVLISGDSDFVPASKLARREGVDFILDPMWQSISDDLFEHIDGLRSTYQKPMV